MRFFAAVPAMCLVAGIALAATTALPAMLALGFFAFGSLFGLAITVRIYWAHIRKGKTGYWPFAILAVLPLVLGLSIVIHDLRYPPINDVSTDLDNPPPFVAALEAPANDGRDMSYPERFVPIVRENYADVQPLTLDLSPERVFDHVNSVANTQPNWRITRSDADRLIVEGEVASYFFRFVDDVVIRISQEDGKTRVDMRSKSREGLIDAGANAKRIRAFFEELRRESSPT